MYNEAMGLIQVSFFRTSVNMKKEFKNLEEVGFSIIKF
jgi:hypothetical protein